MSEVRIAAEPRSEFGKGAARRIRRAHKVPAVLYGHGESPRHLALPGHDLMLALKTPNVLLALDLGAGEPQLALPRDVQRDPVKGHLEHVDLVVVNRGEKVTVDIPVTVTGEAASGGLVVVDQQVVSVEAEATHIPDSVEVSVEGLDVGTQIHAEDLDLPAGVTLQADPDVLLVNVAAAPSAEELEADLAQAEAEVGIIRDTPVAEAEAAAEAVESGTAEVDAPPDEVAQA